MESGGDGSIGEATTDQSAGIGAYAALTWRTARRRAQSGAALLRGVLARHLNAGYSPNCATAEREPPNIALADVTIAYRTTVAVEVVTGSFPPRSMTAIVGPNGAGKSTLLKAIAGIIEPQSGTLSQSGACFGDIAYLPQSAQIDRDFAVSVVEFVSLGGWRRFGAFRPAHLTRAEATSVLAQVGLSGVFSRPIADLSEGQFRRALFARLALQQASVLLLDEPFAAIDEATTSDLLGLVERWHRNGRTVIAVLHDLALVRQHFPLTLLLAHRPISWGETCEVLAEENLAKAGLGTRALANSPA
jgi:zinc/manganese transport system ATP-binding protein